ncbi:MAG: Ig-like domain-containing protein, partial [Clostridia bacterium]|nr:Ig-like domain-containing protein [Clostridia bacterium]
YTIGDLQIYGIGGKMVDGVATFYKNNILTKSGSATYMGDTETTSPACPAGTGISSEKWYTLKLVVNNGLGYYSVEILDKNGASIQRVGGINFQNGCPAISNIRFQAPTEGSVVYLDDYTVNKVEQDALLYEDDFNIYTGFSATPKTYTVGTNLFNLISQFRVQNKDSQFVLGTKESDSADKFLQLKASKYADLNYYTANAIYMPWNGHILTKESQAARGKLQLKFSFRVDGSTAPKGTSASFRVICVDDFNASDIGNLANDNYTMFRVQPFPISGGGVAYGIQKSSENIEQSSAYQQITKDTWYDVQLTFDLVNDKVNMTVVKQGDKVKLTYERSTGLYNGGTPLASLKGVMFKATDGMIADIDNFELKYLPESPRVAASGAEIIDYSGEKVSATEGVNPAVALIKVPFTADMSEESLKNITLKAENATEAFTGYKGTYTNGVYSMTFNQTLEPGTKYTLTVPTTVTNAVGAFLSAPYTYEFITGAAKDRAEMDILGININTVEDIVNGGNIYVTNKYANTTNKSESCMMILAFYDEDNTMLGSTHVNGSLQPKSINTNFRAPFTIPAADKLDVSKISRAAVYLWDNCDSLRPYCKYMEITKTSAEKK